MNLSIVGAGSWGTALAIVLSPRCERVRLWAHDAANAAAMLTSRENPAYLPGFHLPGNVEPTGSLASIAADSEVVLLAVPAQHLRGVLRELLPHLSGAEIFVSATKGIETHTLSRMSVLLADEAGSRFIPRIAVLSGPGFAREIARRDPAALVVASEDAGLAQWIQSRFSTPELRLYTNIDVTGVEIGAALKNVIAIAAGIVSGLGLGNNTLAALVTRGLAEITRLAVALGARPATLSGLTGLGDLLLTCTGELSRNRRVGLELARGRTLAQTLALTRMISEGVETAGAAAALAHRHKVDMPITEQMNLVLTTGKSPRDGLRDLMDRALGSE